MTPRRPRLVWRKPKPYGFNSPERYELAHAGVVLVVVQRIPGGGWFSYTTGLEQDRWNTSSAPEDLDEVKSGALARTKRALGYPAP